MEDSLDNAHTAGSGEKLVAETQHTAGRQQVCHMYAAVTRILHVDHLTVAFAKHLHYNTYCFRGGIDVDFLERLQGFTVFALLENYLWARNLEFISFTAHGFDQNC